MNLLIETGHSLLHLLFPHVCKGCGTDLDSQAGSLCISCISSLPETGFFQAADNPVEKIFWGRLPLVAASAGYYFTKTSMIQKLMHGLKYHQEKDTGLQLGRLMGKSLSQSSRFNSVDILLPLPLFPRRERERGYNQSALLCEGISEITGIPVLTQTVTRDQSTDTQTKKGRVDRWQNMAGKFRVIDPGALFGKHVLLVDDIITTGATLEACGQALRQATALSISIATLCYTAP